MDAALIDRFSDRLLPGERALWVGRPAQGLRFNSADILLVPFTCMWCGFSIFWEVGVLQTRGPSMFFAIWGIPFVLVGLFMVFGRFLLDATLRRNTAYALTDKRLLIERTNLLSDFAVLGAGQLAHARISERSDGSGTITIGSDMIFSRGGMGNGFSIWLPSRGSPPRLIGIANARGVFDQIQQVATQAR